MSCNQKNCTRHLPEVPVKWLAWILAPAVEITISAGLSCACFYGTKIALYTDFKDILYINYTVYLFSDASNQQNFQSLNGLKTMDNDLDFILKKKKPFSGLKSQAKLSISSLE